MNPRPDDSANEPVEPTVIFPRPAEPGAGNWLVRTFRAVFWERRLPTAVATAIDRILLQLGWPFQRLTVDGARFRVRRQTADKHFVKDVFIAEEYTPRGFEINETDTVVDVGGNIGAFAVFAARRAQRGRVISIEPVSENFSLLVHNLLVNGCRNATSVRAAIARVAGPLPIHLSGEGSGSHSIHPTLLETTKHSEEVDGLTLADIFSRFEVQRCDFLKLDCEGAEFEILEGLPDDVGARIGKVAMEYHTNSIDGKRRQAARLIAQLERFGLQTEIYTDVAGTNRGMIFARRS